MTQRNDIERLLDHWFSDGPDQAPDRVVDIVTDRIERQSQRPVWRLQWRSLPVNAYAKFAVAAAAVLLVAVVGFSMFSGNRGSVGGPVPSPSEVRPSQATPASPAGSSAIIVLKAGTQEDRGSAAELALSWFALDVSRATAGQVAVAVDVEVDTELGMIGLVQRGEYDIAIVPTRAWGKAGVTSFDASMSPMLIDSERLAGAVAQDPIATTMLDGLTTVGLSGLSMWPEDLRHPVSFKAPLLTPASFGGVGIRAIPSDITTSLVAALGGHAMDVDDDYAFATGVSTGSIGGAESGFQNVSSLPTTGTFTGNVTFYPRMDVLVTNPSALAKLTPEQRDALLAAARATTQHIIDTNPTDATAAQGYCATGGKVVIASPDQVATFATALKPVADRLATDPLTRTLVTRIGEIKASLPPPLAVSPCGS
jgi:TRAP-type C4-dicarboxylate transport system substrate-binding protein